MILRDTKGFGLADSLIGLFFLGIGMVALSTLLRSHLKSSTFVQQKYESGFIKSTIELFIRQEDVCGNGFYYEKINERTQETERLRAEFLPDADPPKELTGIRMGDVPVIYTGQVIGPLKVHSLTLSELDATIRKKLDADRTKYAVNFKLRAEKNSVSSGGNPYIDMSFILFLVTDQNNKIVECSEYTRNVAAIFNCPSGQYVTGIDFEAQSAVCSEMPSPTPSPTPPPRVGQWYQVYKVHCPDYCASIGKENVFSPDTIGTGHAGKCTSGEMRVKSALDAGITYKKWWGDGPVTSSRSWYSPESRTGSHKGYCYPDDPRGKAWDNDPSDITEGCYCK